MIDENSAKKRMIPRLHKSVFLRVLRTFLLMIAVLIVALAIVSYLFLRSFIEREYVAKIGLLSAAAEEKLQMRIQESRTATTELASALRWSTSEQTDVGNFDAIIEDQMRRQPHLIAVSYFASDGERMAAKGLSQEPPEVFPQRTVLIPVIDRRGWQAYDVISPVPSAGSGGGGWVMAQFDAASAMSEIASSVTGLGVSGSMFLGAIENGRIIAMRHGVDAQASFTEDIGSVDELIATQSPIALAALGNEGIGTAVDHSGVAVLASSRFLPDLGWGLVITVNRAEVLHGPNELANMLAIVGILFLCAGAVITYSMTKQITGPLIDMSEKMDRLGPSNWRFERSVFTGDEVEHLDQVVGDLTSRLAQVYENQEAVIAQRTEELKKEFAKDRAILRSLTLGLIVVDTSGIAIEINEAARSILKLEESPSGVAATELLQLVRDHKSVSPEEHPIIQCLGRGEAVKISPDTHMDIVRNDSTRVAVRLSVSPLMHDGACAGAIVLFQDVTTERHLDYMKTEFITLASHQLRTPLSTVQWYLELLGGEDENLTEDQKSFIVELRLATRRMSNIVGELMDASRLQKGGVEPVLKTIDMSRFIRSITTEMKGMGAEKHIECHSDTPSEPVLLKSDPMLLSIVMQNLLSNAIKYSREGGEVRVALTLTGSDVVIRVADQGIGIPHADQEHIFEKLYRAHNARLLDVNGSGLGLYSSKNIVEKLGGAISFESREGAGTAFIVSFPNTRLVKNPLPENGVIVADDAGTTETQA